MPDLYPMIAGKARDFSRVDPAKRPFTRIKLLPGVVQGDLTAVTVTIGPKAGTYEAGTANVKLPQTEFDDLANNILSGAVSVVLTCSGAHEPKTVDQQQYTPVPNALHHVSKTVDALEKGMKRIEADLVPIGEAVARIDERLAHERPSGPAKDGRAIREATDPLQQHGRPAGTSNGDRKQSDS
jgi:hypothetical protein